MHNIINVSRSETNDVCYYFYIQKKSVSQSFLNFDQRISKKKKSIILRNRTASVCFARRTLAIADCQRRDVATMADHFSYTLARLDIPHA